MSLVSIESASFMSAHIIMHMSVSFPPNLSAWFAVVNVCEFKTFMFACVRMSISVNFPFNFSAHQTIIWQPRLNTLANDESSNQTMCVNLKLLCLPVYVCGYALTFSKTFLPTR